MSTYSFQLRGTNGSGKTFVAKRLLELSEAVPHFTPAGKPVTYLGTLFGVEFCILGRYETACGGCDALPNVKTVAELLNYYMNENGSRIVFFEGLMISHMLGTVGAMQAALGKHRNILAFLDTPLDVCIQRVVERRAARGNLAPFDPRNVVKDHPRVELSKQNAIRQGYTVVNIDHTQALEDVLCHLRKISAIL